ncbi:indolethylamine N-methyltransferase-like [Rhinophrynus dorsalis]
MNGGGHVPSGMASSGSIRLPSICCAVEGSSSGQGPEGDPSPICTSLAESTMVPRPAGVVTRVSSASSIISPSSHRTPRESPSIGDARLSPSGSLEDFRGSWSVEGLSQITKDLLWDSWAPGTRRCYLSAWNSWVRCGKEDFQKQFDPKMYLDTYFHLEPGSIGDKFVTFYLKQLADIFNSGKVRGKTLIDIGAGPCIYQQLSACEAFEEIIVTDFTDRNREEYEKWLKKKPDAFDWRKVVEQVCKLEGDRKTLTEKEEQLRKTITKVLKCDVLQRNPVDPVVLPQADCVLTSLCLEGACKDFETYIVALKNITSMLKPGGHLVMCGTFGCTFYLVGDVKFTGLNIHEDFLRQALNGAGYDIEKLEWSEKPEGVTNKEADYSAYFVVQAKKQNVL